MRPDWREHVAAMILGQAELEGSLLAGSPTLGPLQQLQIYRDQYLLRVPQALAQDRPGLHALLGADWPALCSAYLLAHPPRSWSLEHLPYALEAFLRERGAPASQIAMCRLDEAVQSSFFAAPGQTPRPDQLAGLPELALQPHVRLLRLPVDVHLFRSAVLAKEATEPLRPGDFPLVVHRRERGVRHTVLSPGAWAVLEGLQRGLPTETALAEAVAGLPEQGLSDQVAAWFRLFVARELVQLA
jgi:hypothetical protein